MNSPRCRSSPPDWSEQEAGCYCTKARPDGETLSVGNDKTNTVFFFFHGFVRHFFFSASALTACLGVVSWKQRPFGLCLEGIGRCPVLWGGLISDGSRGWMTTWVSGVWWTRKFICTENGEKKEDIRMYFPRHSIQPRVTNPLGLKGRYLQTSGAPLVSRAGWKLSAFASAGCALWLTAPLVWGRLASEIWGRRAACCLALPGLAVSGGGETGRAARWSPAGTGSVSSSCILLHSCTSGDTQLQREGERERQREGGRQAGVGERLSETPIGQKFTAMNHTKTLERHKEKR